MYKTILLACCALLLLNCKRGSESSESAQTVALAQVIERSPAALRQTYTQRMALRKTPLPLKQEKSAGRLLPVDEAPLDTAFFVFREDLLDIVAKKDAHRLLAYVDPHIKCGFDSENGLPDFVRQWNLDAPEKVAGSPLWQQLEDVLQRGGVFGPGRQNFQAPYYAATFPETEDALESAVINAREVRMREGPSLTGKVIQNISFEIVTIMDRSVEEETIEGRTYPWFKIKTRSGKEGWVYGRFIGRLAGYHAVFEPLGSKWRMTSFLAGD
ncbi:MAG: SH3 domain-containing protein [Saprospiraceae bacterium]|nr:SH3 domain-containing protein [Saprospiraceae bacterium]MDZ4705604.1 SH3 domain-containing protein [Saprospiraceae bacterium]